MIKLIDGSRNSHPIEHGQKIGHREQSLNTSAQAMLQSLRENSPNLNENNELKRRVSLSASVSDKETLIDDADQEIKTLSRTILHPTGFTYMGELKENKFHGEGRLDLKGTVYHGTFENHQFKKGTITHSDGTMLIGTFISKQLHGVGQVRRTDGTIITGEFNNGHLEKGVIAFPDGKKMRGIFKNNKLHGMGQIVYPDGKEIKGHFIENKPQGNVTMKDGEGNVFYGEMNGKGKLKQNNGYTYVGEFKNYEPEGEGYLYAPDGKFAKVNAKKGVLTRK